MTLEAIMASQRAALERRLRRMVGDAELAADLCQETFARAWARAPRDGDDGHVRAWLHRTASNLALDELRRRRLRDGLPLDETLHAASAGDRDRALEVRAALERLGAHERMLLLLRFEAGLSHREIGELLAISEATARKRLSRARRAFATALREVGESRRPRITLLVADAAPDSCETWLREAGADVTVLDADHPGLTLAGAEGFVLSGSTRDIHPHLYGEPCGPLVTGADLASDRRDLRLVREALADDVPIVGVCRGNQLLNIALGGSLYQDIATHASGSVEHPSDEPHPIRTGQNSPLRSIIGRAAQVGGAHHQAIRRLGRGVRPTAVSPDGVVESIDVPARRFVHGVQWHPEAPASAAAGPLLAEALVRAAGA